MALLLHLETSTRVCSIAVSRDGHLLFSRADREGPAHATLIGPYLDEALAVVERQGVALDAVAVSAGPGSYTGLRIGVSAAKGVCYARQCPLIALSTLELLADTYRHSPDTVNGCLIRPVLDARRMEVYTALYDSDGQCLEPMRALVVDETTFASELSTRPVVFVGNGAVKMETLGLGDNAHFLPDVEPLAEHMPSLAEQAFMEGRFADVAYFEPYYIKDFVATVKKHLIPHH
ncbi:MAG: tRNA (adenosine(37)-N6)-threonylcarbamoyltransferase complex dimerization subunit type 1 TsaB [Bacteroidales bacterium]|jgi:tRNA threonylcarbamoyladenosine biosynthesis protein TsaB|nr:tRNA (adenosine(37)-N6)-threonylcarbamoyltransferase complex dimerization subunit type 1 TsaB [Bacteroidales bacterium]